MPHKVLQNCVYTDDIMNVWVERYKFLGCRLKGVTPDDIGYYKYDKERMQITCTIDPSGKEVDVSFAKSCEINDNLLPNTEAKCTLASGHTVSTELQSTFDVSIFPSGQPWTVGTWEFDAPKAPDQTQDDSQSGTAASSSTGTKRKAETATAGILSRNLQDRIEDK